MFQGFKEKRELYSIVWKHEEGLLPKFLKSFMSGEVFKEKPSFKEREVLEKSFKKRSSCFQVRKQFSGSREWLQEK